MNISDLMNCNKVKSMKISEKEIADSVKDSTDVEASADGKQVRRKGNKALPALTPKDGL